MNQQDGARRPDAFTLRHVFVLVAATAVGLALTRPLGAVAYADWRCTVNIERSPGGIQDGQSTANGAYYTSLYGQDLASHWLGFLAYWSQRLTFLPVPVLISLTWAAVVLAALSRSRGPGVTGCVAGAFALAALGLMLPQSLISASSGLIVAIHWARWWATLCFLAPWAAGLAVVAAWIALAMAGPRPARRDWLDRLGFILSSCWMLLAMTRILSSWLSVFLP